MERLTLDESIANTIKEFNWVFLPYLDSPGHDISYDASSADSKFPYKILIQAEMHPNCIAWNTFGSIKSHVVAPEYLTALHDEFYPVNTLLGLYIRKDYYYETYRKQHQGISLVVQTEKGKRVLFQNRQTQVIWPLEWPLPPSFTPPLTLSRSRVRIVNLERRPDRKFLIQQHFEQHGMPLVEDDFVKAVDGYTLKPDDELRFLFQKEPARCGVVGCAMSHYRMYQELAVSTKYDYYIVYEDDVVLGSNYKQRFEHLLQQLALMTFDLCMIGYSLWPIIKKSFQAYHPSNDMPKVALLHTHHYVGGTYAYIVSKLGARKLLDKIKDMGITNGIDYFIAKKFPDEIVTLQSWPLLADSPAAFTSTSVTDSDIQKSHQVVF